MTHDDSRAGLAAALPCWPEQNVGGKAGLQSGSLSRIRRLGPELLVAARLGFFRFALLANEGEEGLKGTLAPRSPSPAKHRWARLNGPAGWLVLSALLLALRAHAVASIHLGATYAIPVVMAGLRQRIGWSLLLAVAIPVTSFLMRGVQRMPWSLVNTGICVIALITLALISVIAGLGKAPQKAERTRQ